MYINKFYISICKGVKHYSVSYQPMVPKQSYSILSLLRDSYVTDMCNCNKINRIVVVP